MALIPIVQPLDQTTEAALVSHTVYGAAVSLTVNGAFIAHTVVDQLLQNWTLAASTRFGNLGDDSHLENPKTLEKTRTWWHPPRD